MKAAIVLSQLGVRAGATPNESRQPIITIVQLPKRRCAGGILVRNFTDVV